MTPTIFHLSLFIKLFPYYKLFTCCILNSNLFFVDGGLWEYEVNKILILENKIIDEKDSVVDALLFLAFRQRIGNSIDDKIKKKE